MKTMVMGDIEDWILLRGLSREQRHWGAFLVRLQQACPDRHFHCLDLPGAGECYRQRSPWTVAGIRHGLQQRLDGLGIRSRFGILGLSLGGMVALDWMAASDRVAAVIVINSSSTDCSLKWRLRPRALWLGLQILCSRKIETRERLVLRMGSRKHAADEEIVREWVTVQTQRPVKRGTIIKQLLAAAGFSLPRNVHNVPGLVIDSRADTMVSSHCSEQIADYYHWPLQSHCDAGHDLPLDDPEWTVTRIVQWLAEGLAGPRDVGVESANHQ